MDLEFSDEQQLLRDTVRRICQTHFDGETVRALEPAQDKFNRGFWAALRENGICGMRIGEAHGGAQLGALALALVFEEFGRALASSPFLASCVHAAGILNFGGPSIGDQWLSRVSQGASIVIPAWIENDLGLNGTTIGEHNADGTLSAVKSLIPFADVADAFLVHVGRQDRFGWAFVRSDAEGITLSPQANQASQPLFEVRFENVATLDTTLLPTSPRPESDPAFEDVLIAVAAEAVGAASRLLEITTAYANDRRQFGRPIAAFQAISHPLAECATELEGARYLTYQAAWAKDDGRPCAHLARMAKYAATAQFRRLATVSVQVHGGIGYSKEGDPQLYYRRSKYHALMHGAPDVLRAAIANHVLA